MSKVEQLESGVKSLTPNEFDDFRRWFEEYAADEWDRQIEEDIKAGKLDDLAEQALAEHRAGRTREI